MMHRRRETVTLMVEHQTVTGICDVQDTSLTAGLSITIKAEIAGSEVITVTFAVCAKFQLRTSFTLSADPYVCHK